MSGDQPTKASNDLSCTKIFAAAGASPRPLEVHLRRINPGVNQERHDEVMARRVLSEHDFAPFAVCASENH